MNEPRRLSEVGADDFEQELILSARRDAPRPAAMQRTLASIGVGVGTALGVASVAEGAVVVPVKVGAIALTKWLTTGVALGVVTAGGVKLTERAFEPTRPAVTVAAKPAAPRPIKALEATAPADTAAVPVAEAPPSAPPAETAPAPAVNGRSAPVATPSSLPEEVRSLDAVRRALAEGDAPGALALLRRYDATFRAGALSPEARLLEVKALLAAGERARAVAVGRRIVASAPKSPHAEAVRALLAPESFP